MVTQKNNKGIWDILNNILHVYSIITIGIIANVLLPHSLLGACPGNTVNAGDTITVNDGETCTLSGDLEIAGTLIVYGTLDIPNANSVDILDGGHLIIKDGGTVNMGTSGSVNTHFNIAANGQLTNEYGGELNIGSGSTSAKIVNDGTVVNDGLINQNDTSGKIENNGSWTGDGAVNNSGSTKYKGTGNLATQEGRTQPLPVTLHKFYGNAQNGKVFLKWTTVSETNFSHFIVQRSTDGKNYKNIGKVIGTGNSTNTKHYNFADHTPENGINYYRLKAVDIDDTFEYHQVIGVHVKIPGAITIMPNPVQGNHFKLASKIPHATMTIVDKNGQPIESFNIREGHNQIIPNRQLNSGLYIVLIKQNNQVVNRSKLIVR